jgi:ATP-dependent RNA helicase RhlE
MTSVTSAAEELRTLTFDDLPLAPFLKETVKAIGYTTPTPIQAEAIPLVVEGRDLVGLAQTGTGKTAAFVLPILQKLSGSKEKGAKALILAPTRELAEQINDVIKALAPRTGIKSVTIYGGVSHGRQISDLRGKPQIIVACPGRLLDHMSGRTIDLKGIEYLVLDEADRMCDMGFLPDIKKIISKIPTERQTLLFSATMPDEIRDLTNGILNDPALVKVKIEDANTSVTHSMYQVAQKAKPEVLSHWLQENREALVVVFTKMKHTAKRLAEQLARRGQHVTSLHGNLSQGKRQQALNGFKDGRYRILIATDIAARGIDVKGITHVVNYDMPENLDAYIHRTGRAGRASATGDAVSFVTKADSSLLRTIERWLKAPVTRLATPEIEGVEEEMVDTEERQGRRARPGRNASRERPGRRERAERGARRAPQAEGIADTVTAEMTGADDGRAAPDRSGGARFERRARPEGSRRDGDRGGRREGARGERRGRSDGARGDTARREGRNGDRGERRDSHGPRSDRSSDRPRRSFDRRERSESPGRARFNERREHGERQPRYAYGPETEGGNARPRFERGSDERGARPRGRSNDRFGGNRGPRDNRFGGRGERSESNRFERPQRGQPRDRFEGLEGPDLSQVEALKVLEKREQSPRGGERRNHGGARGPRSGGFGGGRPHRGGDRSRGSQGPRRTWDR